MTDMRRMTISLPDDVLPKIEAKKQEKEFAHKPYSIRHLISLGLKYQDEVTEPPAERPGA